MLLTRFSHKMCSHTSTQFHCHITINCFYFTKVKENWTHKELAEYSNEEKKQFSKPKKNILRFWIFHNFFIYAWKWRQRCNTFCDISTLFNGRFSFFNFFFVFCWMNVANIELCSYCTKTLYNAYRKRIVLWAGKCSNVAWRLN